MKIYRVKTGKEKELRVWGTRLMSDLHAEALDTLNEENCVREFFNIFKIGEDFFAVAHMEGRNIQRANMDRPINQQHRAMMRECLDEEVVFECLYDLYQP